LVLPPFFSLPGYWVLLQVSQWLNSNIVRLVKYTSFKTNCWFTIWLMLFPIEFEVNKSLKRIRGKGDSVKWLL
jgi:hypothetical protein